MTTFTNKLYQLTQKLFDLFAMMAAFWVAFMVVWGQTRPVGFGDFLSMRIKVSNFVILLGLLLAWYLIFLSGGLYLSRRLNSFKQEAVDIMLACTLGTFLVGVAGLLCQVQVINLAFVGVFWGAVFLFTLMVRSLLKRAVTWLRLRGRNLRFLLVVGTGRVGREFAARIKQRPELGYRLVGFVDDEPAATADQVESGETVCSLANLRGFLLENVVDEVALCLPPDQFVRQAQDVVEVCREQGVTVRYSTRIFSGESAGVGLEGEEADVITVSSNLLQGWPGLIKRGLDLVIALPAAAVLLPAGLVIGLLVRFSSPGPAMFAQERMGLNKRGFKLLKFRTMVVGAEQGREELQHLNQMGGPVFKVEADPRITPVGRFLRRWSLDELPQLINVIRGEMSLVGPRPLILAEHRDLPERWQIRRCSVRPGLTGLWQVSGRNEVGFEEWMRLDMAYIDRWSLSLDWRILLKTFIAVVRGRGAM